MNSVRYASWIGCSLLLVGCSEKHAGHAPHWGYDGETGPAHWADLDPGYSLARDGREQSPIAIESAACERADLAAIHFQYAPSRLAIVNNGHTIQVDYDEGSTIEVDGESFQLAQFHFHAPSEHAIDGVSFPLEMHMVHANAAGELAVVGVMMQVGAANEAVAPWWSELPAKEGTSTIVEGVRCDAESMLPGSRDYYTYPGSLTTPPCSEGVKWLVLREPVTLSSEQIEAFRAIVHDNSRPTQPLNGRTVWVSF